MPDEFDAVVERVRERVTPTLDERERLDAAVTDIVYRAESAVADLPVDAEVVQVGSTARGTWIAGDRDIDVFVSFPPDLDRDQLEEYGLEVGHAVLPDGHEEYAEHPYVVGEYDGYEVDLVPCYAVEDATEIQSTVDRTPFHTRYLKERLDDDVAGEVRVCKQFFKAIGVYGSDLRTRGFSGFLTELLVLEFGGLRELLEAAADWHPPVVFDPENHGKASFEGPLVVIDPTDPERNVAAVLSEANVARLQHYARDLLADPRKSLFESAEPDPLDADAVRAVVADRGTTPVAVRFTAPDVVDDQLWPQLEKSRSGIADELDRRGFDVFRSAAFATDREHGTDAPGTAVLLFELAVAERPRVERHAGPPVHVREHACGFYEKYAGDGAENDTGDDAENGTGDGEDGDGAATAGPPYGPFVAGDRYVVERTREFASAAAFLDSDAVFDVGLGAHVESRLEDGYDLLVGDEVRTLADTLGTDLAAYFDPRP